MSLGLNDVLTFGAHKGKKLEDIYELDCSYLCWLRNARRDDNGDHQFFDLELNALLDATIRDDANLQRRFKPWAAEIQWDPTKPVDASSEISDGADEYDEWGTF